MDEKSCLKLDAERYLVALLVHLMLNRKLSRSGNGNRFNGLVTSRGLDVFHSINNVHTLKNMTKDNVSVIEPSCLDSANEELASVGVTASVGHGENTGTGVLQLEVLVRELATVNGLAASTIALGKVTTLDHKVLDNSVERRALIAVTKVLPIRVLTSSKRTEVLGSLGHSLAVKTHDDSTEGLTTMFNVKVDLVGDDRALGGVNARGEDEAYGHEEGDKEGEE